MNDHPPRRVGSGLAVARDFEGADSGAAAMSPLRWIPRASLCLTLALALSACARSESAQDASVSVAAGIDQQSRAWDEAEEKAGRPAAVRRGPEAAAPEPASPDVAPGQAAPAEPPSTD